MIAAGDLDSTSPERSTSVDAALVAAVAVEQIDRVVPPALAGFQPERARSRRRRASTSTAAVAATTTCWSSAQPKVTAIVVVVRFATPATSAKARTAFPSSPDLWFAKTVDAS